MTRAQFAKGAVAAFATLLLGGASALAARKPTEVLIEPTYNGDGTVTLKAIPIYHGHRK